MSGCMNTRPGLRMAPVGNESSASKIELYQAHKNQMHKSHNLHRATQIYICICAYVQGCSPAGRIFSCPRMAASSLSGEVFGTPSDMSRS